MLAPNLEPKGRAIRGLGSLSLAVASALTWSSSRAVAITLGASALFVAFEAARGWCALRACGVRTKF